MAKHKSKASKPQRQSKPIHSHLRDKLAQLDDDLYNLLQSHQFYQESVMALAENDVEPDYWLIGASVTHRWLRQQGDGLMTEVMRIKQNLNA